MATDDAVALASLPSVNDVLKSVVATGISYIPVAGNLVSSLVGLLWPASAVDVWSQIRQEVEQMIDEKINDAVFSLLQQKLVGLGAALQLYVAVVEANRRRRDLSTVRMQFIATNTLFVAAAPEFKNESYEWTIGPLFAIFTQLHMSLLRDCVLHGADWGWSAADFKVYVDMTGKAVADYFLHFDKVLNNRRNKLQPSAPTSPGTHKTDIHNYWQQFTQQSTVFYDDYRLLLEHLDPITHPGATQTINFKDVYSRAYGTADEWDATASAISNNGVTTPFSKPIGPFQTIDLEFFNYGPRVVNLNHSTGTGPLKNGVRVDKYGLIASVLAGVEKSTITFTAPPSNRLFNVSSAFVRVGSIPLALTLITYDNNEKWMWDKHVVPGGQRYTVEVSGRMLTTLNMWTRSTFYDKNVGAIIFGFSVDPVYVPPSASRLLYVTAVGEPTSEMKRLITPDPTLEAEREAYWHYINSFKPAA